MKRFRYLILSVITALTFINSYSQNYKDYLEELVEKSVKVSPALKSLRFKQQVSKSKIAQVSNLPDPVLKLGLANLPTNSFSLTQEPMTSKLIGLSQMIPFPGKLSAAENVQAKEVKLNQQEIEDKANEIRRDISNLYFDLSYTREAIKISEKNIELLKALSEVTKAKYSVNKASQQNVIKVEVELTRLKDNIEKLFGLENEIETAIQSFLLADNQYKIKTDILPEVDSTSYSLDQLIKLSEKHRPFLKGIKISEEKAAAIKDLARYEFYPDFNFSIQYNQREKIGSANTDLNDFLSIVVGVNLPINYGGKKTAKVEEALGLQNMYAEQYQASVQFLHKVIGKSLAKINQLKKREKLIASGLFPQAGQSFKSALSSYQVNEIDFLNVIEAQSQLFKVELDLFKIRAEYLKEISNIEFYTGIKL